VLTIGDFDRVITARLPKRGDRVNIFAPEIVVWAYEGPPEQALQALLDLVHPDHPDVPTTDYSPLYTRRTDDESRILDTLADEPEEGNDSDDDGLPGVPASKSLTLGSSVIAQSDCLCWWAILGLNQ
jgi:hypothetical protein